MTPMHMWKYYRKAAPTPADEVPRRVRIASLTCGITIGLLLAVAALTAPKELHIALRILPFGFVAFFLLEFPSLFRQIVAHRAIKGRIPVIVVPAAVFSALAVFLTICILLPREPSGPLTDSRLLFLGAANLGLAAILRVANRASQANLSIRQKRAAIENRLAEAAEKAAKGARESEDSHPKST